MNIITCSSAEGPVWPISQVAPGWLVVRGLAPKQICQIAAVSDSTRLYFDDLTLH
jgi:hypothetical protein